MQFLKNNEIDISKWKELHENAIYFSIFQTYNFYEYFNSIDNYSADVFAVEEKQVLLSLVVVTVQKERGIKANFSSRGIVYGSPLVLKTNNNAKELLIVKESFKYLLKYITSYFSNLIYIEIRNSYDLPYNDIIHSSGYKYFEHLNVQLRLDGFTMNEVLQRMKYNRRREIRTSFKEGATVDEANDIQEVYFLYSILKELYLKKVKLPLPVFSFFEKLFNNKNGKVFIVKHNNQIIGGSFCFYIKNQVISTLSYVGLRNYHKKIFPTHLAIIGAIDFAIKNKIKIFDFMGAGKPNEAYGVRDYKLQFGGDLVEYGRYVKINKPVLYFIGKVGVKVLGWVRSVF